MGMGGSGTGQMSPQAQVGGFGSPAQTAVNSQAQGGVGGGFGGGMGGGFGGGMGGSMSPMSNDAYMNQMGSPSRAGTTAPTPGQTFQNFQATDAQRQYQPQQRAPQYQQYQPQQRAPQYQQYQPQQRAPQYQQQRPNYQSGLQAALMNMMQQYNRPMMRAPLQQGISPSSPLTYRPPAVNNTNRVAPSVEEQQRQAAAAAASASAQSEQTLIDAFQRQQYEDARLAAQRA